MSSAVAATPPFRIQHPYSVGLMCGRRVHGSLPTETIHDQRSQVYGSRITDVARPLSGLCTPPFDNMSTTCHHPQMGSYDLHAPSAYPPPVYSQAERHQPALTEAIFQTHQQPYFPLPSQQLQHPQPQARAVLPSILHSQERPGISEQSWNAPVSSQTQMSSAASSTGSMASEGIARTALEMHSLQIPACISAKGGSLADLAAQITCFFWFESPDIVQNAEKLREQQSPQIYRLSKYSTTIDTFKKWVHGILTTTQVTSNVVLLALLFIYRLKKKISAIKGRPGSEFRLLTVALMLGNKFLDDNTYTNKTWAEVSHISVQDIHVMEVEFLSNMRYSLYTTKKQWEEWLNKLGCFWEYYGMAQGLPISPRIVIPSPSMRAHVSPLPSPTSLQPIPPITPTVTIAYSPTPALHTNSQHWQATLQASQASSPLSSRPNMGPRKRSMVDDYAVEPPAKRLSIHQPQPLPPSTARSQVAGEQGRIAVPSLTINTNQVSSAPPISYTPTSSMTPLAHVSLPPLVAGVRAMSTVYPSMPSSMPQIHTPATSAPAPMPATAYSSSLPPHSSMGYGTPTKHQSPKGFPVYGSSPLSETFPPCPGVHTPISHTPLIHTPISHSPSIYLQQRASPYKPIRHVNTLLYPPPSASLQEYHLSVPVQPSNMHYQPLGRRNDLRTGIVPEFRHLG